MTVEKLETAKGIVEEAGADQVEAIYEYKHAWTGKQLWAVFMRGSYIDIYEAPFCLEPKLIFENGVWT